MKTQNTANLVGTILLLVLAMCKYAWADQVANSVWKDKNFTELFTGGYGMNTKIEPSVNPEEHRFIRSLPKLIDADPMLAIDAIRASLTPKSSPAFHFILGQLYIDVDNWDLAIKSYNKAIVGFPNFVRAHRSLGLAYMAQDRCEDAKVPLIKLMDLGEARGTTFGFLAYCAFQDKRFAEAANYYHMARIYQPEDLDWKIGAANAYIEAGRTDEASVLLDDLIETAPENIDYLMLQTNLWLKKEDRHNAIVNLELIDKLEQPNADSALLLGDLYVQQGLVSLAYPHYQTALNQTSISAKNKPDFDQAKKAFSYLANANMWSEAEQYLQALELAYGKSANKQETIEFTYMNAKLALASNNADKAISKLTQLLRDEPLHSEALLLTADYYFKQQDYYQAELFYQRASHLDASAYLGYLGVAKSAAQVGQYQKSITAYQKADFIHPSELIKRNIETLKRVLLAGS